MTKPRHDPLLSAVIAKLPVDAASWPRSGRIAWLRMVTTAFDVVYGPCDGIRIEGGAAGGNDGAGSGESDAIAPLHGPAGRDAAPPSPPGIPQRFYVDRDGFAMADGRPVGTADLPAGAVLWDERTGLESGDASTILWRDTGASRERLPPGVTLRPAFDAS